MRIFTPGMELPFAGHPTLGTAFVMVSEGRVTSPATQVVAAGEIPVEVDVAAGTAWMTQLPASFGRVFEDRDLIATAIGLELEDLAAELPVHVPNVPFVSVRPADGRLVIEVDGAPFTEYRFRGEQRPHFFLGADRVADDEHRLGLRTIGDHGAAVGAPEVVRVPIEREPGDGGHAVVLEQLLDFAHLVPVPAPVPLPPMRMV